MGGLCQGSSSQQSAQDIKMQYFTIASSNLFAGESLEIAIQYSLNVGFDIIDKNQSLLEKDKNSQKEKLMLEYKILQELYNTGEDSPAQVTDYLKQLIDIQTKIQKMITTEHHSQEELNKLIKKEQDKLKDDHLYLQVQKQIQQKEQQKQKM